MSLFGRWVRVILLFITVRSKVINVNDKKYDEKTIHVFLFVVYDNWKYHGSDTHSRNNCG